MENKYLTKPQLISCISVIALAILIPRIHFHGSALWEWIKCNSKLGDFITAFASIASLSASAVVAHFGYQISNAQKNIAKEKLKLDLFDRRYKIYSTFNIALAALTRNDLDSPAFCVGEDSPHDKLDPFFTIRNCQDEARFLLDGGSFKELDKIFLDIIFLHNKIVESKMHALYPDEPDEKEERKKLKEEYRDIKAKIGKYQLDLPKIFAKYMSFEDLKIK